ncbi:Plasmodium exported protein (PHISTa), unknown, putative [Plasmodium gaboni]|uniref:Plasmodium RESA N-terminal domain-containing protein n=1 Tax=Plasmodium gaboni TaxID=647221 RepID=A0ABY0KWH9_9APIC|nr:Plasmodium exported protein (PHISTa), unknown, putative [Plasmodium gaboni]
MESKKNCIIFSLYSDNKNQKRTLRYISFKLICLSLYIIGFYYVFLNTSLENKGLQIVKNGNVYERNLSEAQKESNGSQKKRNLKLKNEDVNKTKDNTNNIKSNEQNIQERIYSINHDDENNHVENKSNSSINNINYNDMSKNLTEKELYDVLNSLKECPPKEDLRNIWTHTLGIAKEGLDNIYQQLKASIQKYLDNDISVFSYVGLHMLFNSYVYKDIWNRNMSRFYKTLVTEELEYNNKFFSLINGKHTLDDILKFIYSFLEHFKTLKKQLHKQHQKELLADVELQWYIREQCKFRP